MSNLQNNKQIQNEESQREASPANDVVLEIDKKSFFTLIVNKRLDNPKYCSPEEIMIDVLFKYFNMKYHKIEYFSDDMNLFFGKIPVICTMNNIIENKNLPKFIFELFLQEKVPFLEKIDKLLYILKEVYKVAFEYLMYLKNKEKQQSAKLSIFQKIKNFIFKDNTYEKNIKLIFDNLSKFNDNNEYEISTEEKAKGMMIQAYNFILEIYDSEILRKDKTLDFKKRELLLNVLIYSYIKEEIDIPAFSNYFHGNEKINKMKSDIINYIDREVLRKYSNPIQLYNFKVLESCLLHLKNTFCMKKFNAKKETDIIADQMNSNIKSHIITLFTFVGTAGFFYLLSRRKEKKFSERTVAPDFLRPLR